MIHYKVTQVENVVVFQCLQASHTCELEIYVPNENFSCIEIYKSDDAQLARVAECSSSDNAFAFINKIHEAIHAEYVGEWEPQKHDQVLGTKEGSQTICEYFGLDKDGKTHVCVQRDTSGSIWDIGQYSKVSQIPENMVAIPTGPCEVAYGIEGLEEGVQENTDHIMCHDCMDTGVLEDCQGKHLCTCITETDAYIHLIDPQIQKLKKESDELGRTVDRWKEAYEGLNRAKGKITDDLKSHISALETKRKIDDHNMEAVCHIEEKMKSKINRLEKELEDHKEKAGTWTDEDMVSFGTAVSQIMERGIKGKVNEWFIDWHFDYKGGDA